MEPVSSSCSIVISPYRLGREEVHNDSVICELPGSDMLGWRAKSELGMFVPDWWGLHKEFGVADYVTERSSVLGRAREFTGLRYLEILCPYEKRDQWLRTFESDDGSQIRMCLDEVVGAIRKLGLQDYGGLDLCRQFLESVTESSDRFLSLEHSRSLLSDSDWCGGTGGSNCCDGHSWETAVSHLISGLLDAGRSMGVSLFGVDGLYGDSGFILSTSGPNALYPGIGCTKGYFVGDCDCDVSVFWGFLAAAEHSGGFSAMSSIHHGGFYG